MAKLPLDREAEYSHEPRAAAREASAHITRAARRAVGRFESLNVAERNELMALLGLRGATEDLVASNCRLRVRSTHVLVELLESLISNGKHRCGRRYWHVSFLGPAINEYRPALDIDA